MLSNKEIIVPNNLLNAALKNKGVKAGIVNAGKPLPMLSVQDAVKENLIDPIFIGDEKEIIKCAEDIKWDISKYEIINEPVENNTAGIAAKLASEGKIKIIGVGGVDSGESAYEKFLAGANYIQLYTGMVYRGPNIVSMIKKELRELLLKDGVKNFNEIVGNHSNR